MIFTLLGVKIQYSEIQVTCFIKKGFGNQRLEKVTDVGVGAVPHFVFHGRSFNSEEFIYDQK